MTELVDALCTLAAQARALRLGAPLESCAIAQIARRGCFGAEFRRGEQDANLFFVSVLTCVARDQPHPETVFDDFGLHFESCFGAHSVIDDCVFGAVLRIRRRCQLCHATRDRLEPGHRCFVINLQETSESCVSALWGHVFAAQPKGLCPSRSDPPCGTDCAGEALHQIFLEKEPPFIVLSIQRTQDADRQFKDMRRIVFPETLPCSMLRTGPYRLVGAILHHGRTARTWHYTAICQTGPGVYHHFDDGTARLSSWAELSSERVQVQVSLLMYARDGAGPAAGHFQTPYLRGADTAAILGDAFVEPPRAAPRVGSPIAPATSVAGIVPSSPHAAPALAAASSSGTDVCDAMARLSAQESTAVAASKPDPVRILTRRLSECSLDDARAATGSASASSAAAQPRTSMLKRPRPSTPGPTSDGDLRRARIVTGFGSERVDDLAADEQRRIDEGLSRHADRKEAGVRGRAVDMTGKDLDRSVGGAWHAGRR